MNSPAKQALLVLMLVAGGCNGTVTLIDGMAPEAAPPEASTEGGGEAPAGDAPKSEVMASDASDGGTVGTDASDAAEVATPTDGAETEGGGQ